MLHVSWPYLSLAASRKPHACSTHVNGFASGGCHPFQPVHLPCMQKSPIWQSLPLHPITLLESPLDAEHKPRATQIIHTTHIVSSAPVHCAKTYL